MQCFVMADFNWNSTDAHGHSTISISRPPALHPTPPLTNTVVPPLRLPSGQILYGGELYSFLRRKLAESALLASSKVRQAVRTPTIGLIRPNALPSATLISGLFTSPSARCVIFRNGDPLVLNDTQDSRTTVALAKVPSGELRGILGDEPFFGQGQHPGETIAEDIKEIQGVRWRGPNLVFLGVDEQHTTPTSVDDVRGTPYFALDVSDVPTDFLGTLGVSESQRLDFTEPRSATAKFSTFDASLFALARTMVDWLGQRKFCPACGSKSVSIWSGWKLKCSSALPWADNGGKPPCPSSTGLRNYQHPRSDMVVITAVLDETGDRILLGRNKKFPSGEAYRAGVSSSYSNTIITPIQPYTAFYSTLAGFIEPAETLEDAVKREIWEEAGIKVNQVRYHSGQPWPFPANLMIGCFATADSSQTIRTDLDNELEDAKWFTREEVLSVLAHPDGTNIRRREYKNFDEAQDQSTRAAAAAGPIDPQPPKDQPPFRVPPLSAIAGVLISQWAKHEVSGLGPSYGGATSLKGKI
ncbi:unnamed protein product [Rhizoctonia solani]|uniref:NAD(+) diphosphatase n=1 Tax=Rhizoctonia solani TaxID=456999 RepID=A0A8H3DUI4_9AGAM|nr:unnamed protein product [Rhizoctonia solani]